MLQWNHVIMIGIHVKQDTTRLGSKSIQNTVKLYVEEWNWTRLTEYIRSFGHGRLHVVTEWFLSRLFGGSSIVCVCVCVCTAYTPATLLGTREHWIIHKLQQSWIQNQYEVDSYWCTYRVIANVPWPPYVRQKLSSWLIEHLLFAQQCIHK